MTSMEEQVVVVGCTTESAKPSSVWPQLVGWRHHQKPNAWYHLDVVVIGSGTIARRCAVVVGEPVFDMQTQTRFC